MKDLFFRGIKIDNCTLEEALAKIEGMLKGPSRHYVVTPNASHVVRLCKDKDFKRAYEKASLALPDGMGIIWASKFLGNPLRERVTGADLFLETCNIASSMGKGIFLLGGVHDSEKMAALKLAQLYKGLNVNFYAPPLGFENNIDETKKIIETINKMKPDILFLCVGTPKSEKWIADNIDKLNISLCVITGAALNFVSGRIKRAPKWMQKRGLEWLFRLIQEPNRLWKRYLIENPIFIWLVLMEFVKTRMFKK